LGNVARLLWPMVVIDEGHHGYTENALKTLDGFNPGFLLELSATPRIASAKGSGSNILVDVRGTDLDEAQMIKLPIHVDVQHWSDWQSCLAASVQRLDALQREADVLRGRRHATSAPFCWCRWSAPGPIRVTLVSFTPKMPRPTCCSWASPSGRSRSRPRTRMT
jgi:type III restriction enzyme